MKKILILKDGLHIGGITSSYLAFLKSMANQNAYAVYTWINIPEGMEIELPAHVKIIECEELKEIFARPSTAISKFKTLLKNRQVISHIYSRILHSRNHTDRRLLPCYQKLEIAAAMHAKKIDLTQYDAVLTWEEGLPCYLLAEAIQAKKKIAWIHPDYKKCGYDSRLDEPLFAALDGIAAVSKSGAESLRCAFPMLKNRIFALQNGIDVEKIRELSREPATGHFDVHHGLKIVTVARLQNISKAHDRAIRIAARLKSLNLKFQWIFVGDGEDRTVLERQAEQAELQKYVVFTGEQKNPYPYVADADLFVLQSYYEGRPIAVDESLILGTPVLVTAYPSSREQVSPAYGWIADNNEEKIFLTLQHILENPELLQQKRKNLTQLDCGQYLNSTPVIEMLDDVLKR